MLVLQYCMHIAGLDKTNETLATWSTHFLVMINIYCFMVIPSTISTFQDSFIYNGHGEVTM